MRRVAAFVLVFGSGLALGWLAKGGRPGEPRRPETADYSQPVTLTHLETTDPRSGTFVPYAAVVDGKEQRFGTPPARDSDVWLIKLAGGRVIVSATRDGD